MAFDQQEYERYLTLIEEHTQENLQGLAQYRYFHGKLAALSDTLRRWYTPAEDGLYPTLSAGDVAALNVQYSEVVNAAVMFRGALPPNPGGPVRACLAIAEQAADFCARDQKVLQNSTGMSGITMPEVVRQARTSTLNLGNARLDGVGGAQSSRVPVEYTDDNGNTVKGFFCPLTLEDNLAKDAARLINETCYDPTLPDEARKKSMTYHQALLALFDTDDFRKWATSPVEATKLVATFKDKPARDYFKDTLAKAKLPQKTVAALNDDPYFAVLTCQYIQKVNGSLFRRGYAKDAPRMENTLRMEERNAAMCDVADLLGVPNLLVRTVKTTATHNGKQVEGIFMRRASGMDSHDLTELGEDGRYRPKEITTRVTEASVQGEVLKSLAQLQVLDYICGNTDRHDGNMLYTFSEGNPAVLTGITGIDNDSCLGKYTRRGGERYMVSPDDMGALPKSMADRVMALTPETLRKALDGYHLSEAELNAAWVRTTHMQQAIQDGLEFERTLVADAPDEESREKMRRMSSYPRIIPDDQWANLKAADLTTPVYTQSAVTVNYFDNVTEMAKLMAVNAKNIAATQNSNLKTMAKRPQDAEALRRLMFPRTETVRGTLDSPAMRNNAYRHAEKLEMNNFAARLAQVDKGFFIGSKQFHDLRASVRETNARLQQLRLDGLPEQERTRKLEQLLVGYLDIKKNAKPYLDKKNNEEIAAKASKTAVNRRAFARDLNDFVTQQIYALQRELLAPVLRDIARSMSSQLAADAPAENRPPEAQPATLLKSPAFRKMMDGKSLAELLELKHQPPQELVQQYRTVKDSLTAAQKAPEKAQPGL